MRRMIDFDCKGDRLAGTLDVASGITGLLIVSGGNEIRSGAYAGQAALAAKLAAKGYPVFRYDRRGIGDSEGINIGFESSAADIASAIAAFRSAAPEITRMVAFGNCDAATALALFHMDLPLDALILANPWVMETTAAGSAPATPSAAAIRSRYWARLQNPRSIVDLMTGKIDLKKLFGGLVRAARQEAPSTLAVKLADALTQSNLPVTLLLARRDTTALAFCAAWHGASYAAVRARTDIMLAQCDSASHSFADAPSRTWLSQQIERVLSAAKQG